MLTLLLITILCLLLIYLIYQCLTTNGNIRSNTSTSSTSSDITSIQPLGDYLQYNRRLEKYKNRIYIKHVYKERDFPLRVALVNYTHILQRPINQLIKEYNQLFPGKNFFKLIKVPSYLQQSYYYDGGNNFLLFQVLQCHIIVAVVENNHTHGSFENDEKKSNARNDTNDYDSDSDSDNHAEFVAKETNQQPIEKYCPLMKKFKETFENSKLVTPPKQVVKTDVLAHAHLPNPSKQIEVCLDADNLKEFLKKDFCLKVLEHEFGHVLGLHDISDDYNPYNEKDVKSLLETVMNPRNICTTPLPKRINNVFDKNSLIILYPWLLVD